MHPDVIDCCHEQLNQRLPTYHVYSPIIVSKLHQYYRQHPTPRFTPYSCLHSIQSCLPFAIHLAGSLRLPMASMLRFSPVKMRINHQPQRMESESRRLGQMRRDQGRPPRSTLSLTKTSQTSSSSAVSILVSAPPACG